MPIIMPGRDGVFQNGFDSLDERLDFWLDASNSDGFNTDSNDNLIDYTERSNNGYSGFLRGTGSPPKRVTNVQNGKAVLRFFGGQILSFGDVLDQPFITSAAQTTFFAVYKNRGTSSSTGTIFNKVGDITQGEDERQYFFLVRNNAPEFFFYGQLFDATFFPFLGMKADVTVGISDFQLSAVNYDATLPTPVNRVDHRFNSTEVSESINTSRDTVGLNGILDGDAEFCIAGQYGKNGPVTSSDEIDIAEIRIYDQILSTSEIQTIESELTTKWGL